VLAVVLGIPLALLFGAFLEWALFSHLYKRDHLEQVLLTYGLILIFEQLRSAAGGRQRAWGGYSCVFGHLHPAH